MVGMTIAEATDFADNLDNEESRCYANGFIRELEAEYADCGDSFYGG
jgi:hypothetical protein